MKICYKFWHGVDDNHDLQMVAAQQLFEAVCNSRKNDRQQVSLLHE